MRFELFHIHGKELLGNPIAPKNRLHHFRELVHLDNLRRRIIENRIGARRQASERSDHDGPIDDSLSFSTPMMSESYTHRGVYFVKFKIGTPPQEFLLVADTGSDLTWVHCRYQCPHCPRLGKGPHHRRVFEAGKSCTFSPIGCSSSLCKQLPFALERCPTRHTPCVYEYNYMSGARVWGIYENESATLTLSNGNVITIENVTVGCSTSYQGESFSVYEGMLALGMSTSGFGIVAMSQVQQFSKFSYCLVNHLSPRNVSNYLNFGPVPTGHLQYVPLVFDADVTGPFYFVPLKGISVDGTILKIPKVLWSAKADGGVILDCGTSITVLAEPAYKEVYAAVSGLMKKVFKPYVEEDLGFEFCFDGGNVSNKVVKQKTPRLVFHMNDHVLFEPHWKNYVIDVADGIKCLGFQKGSWPGPTIFGNILQQEFFWEFDLDKQRVGFAPQHLCSP